MTSQEIRRLIIPLLQFLSVFFFLGGGGGGGGHRNPLELAWVK